MEKIKTISYFPKNRKDQELYKFFSEVIDEGIYKYFSETFQENRDIFKPNSDYYNPDYILSLNLGEEISSLLEAQPLEVKKSLSLIYPGLIKIRGTERAISTFLGLIDIKFLKIVYIKQKNGCTNATIVIKPGQTISKDTEKLLYAISLRFLPICVKLLGVNNCEEKNDEDYDLGQHLLSVNFRLSKSVLSYSQGVPDENGLIIKNCKLK